MFSHYYKVQVIRLRRRDDVFEVAAAVAAEKGVNMNDAFKLSEAAVVFGLSALGIQLLNRRMQPAEFVTTIGEGSCESSTRTSKTSKNFFQRFTFLRFNVSASLAVNLGFRGGHCRRFTYRSQTHSTQPETAGNARL